MAILFKNFKKNIFNSVPLIILYFLCISEIDTSFSNLFEILSFNLQLIVIYYWMLRDQTILGTGHVFTAGIVNDVGMGLPLGISSITYLVITFAASYIKQLTVKFSLFSDWFTFLIAIFFSNLVFLIFIFNFTDIRLSYAEIFYNSFFTVLFYPIFWFCFQFYKNLMYLEKNE